MSLSRIYLAPLVSMWHLFAPANDLYEMELIGDQITMVGVPINAPEELKRRVLGAIKSYHARLKSVDYTLKHYGDSWRFPEPSEEQKFLLETLRTIERRVKYTTKLLTSGEERPEVIGLFAAEAALIRLEATFRSASLLIMQGYPFESASICRIVLEQMAWAYSVYEQTNKDTVIQTKATKAITKFKEILPNAGQLYGALSSQTHLDPENNRHYIVTEEGGAVVIRHYLPQDTKLILAYLLILVKTFYQTTTIISGAYIQEEKETRYDFIPNYKTDTEILAEALDQIRREISQEKNS